MAATIITSILTGGSNNHASVSTEFNAYATDFVTQGVLGSLTNTNGSAPTTGSFGVNQDSSPDMGITIKGTGNTGNGESIAYITCTPSSQDKQVLRARMSSDYTSYTINANSTGVTVYDWIYLNASATNAGTPDSAADNVVALFTSRSTSNTADNGSPPTYGTLLAVVTVANGAASIANTNIADKRTQAGLSSTAISTSSGYTTLGFPLTYATNAGNKSFTVTTPNNLTGVLSPGMKLQVSRSVTPPSQCMAFASASSQYATKTSPSSISFTSAFTVEAWVYLQSYTGSNQSVIARRTGSTGAWGLQISSTGQPDIYYGDGSGNFTVVTAYQSIPLNRWVHLAGVVTSTSSKTGLMYINGFAVPTVNSSNAAATLVQIGNLSIGCYGAGTAEFFNGYISEARVWSTAQNSTAVQNNMTINLSGSETNLVALFQGNGNFTDTTANVNTLTATNGAVATQNANPYNAIEYAVVTTVTYSNPTTTLTLSTGDTGTIPNQTLNNPLYSTSQEPYGLPNDLSTTVGRRLLFVPINGAQTTASTSAVNFNPLIGLTATVPGNCSMVKFKLFNTSLSASSSGTIVMLVYNGSVATANNVGQINQDAANTQLTTELLIPVISGSTFTLNVQWETSAGTATWSGSANQQLMYASLETA